MRKSDEGIEKNSEQNTYFICLEEKKNYLCCEMYVSKRHERYNIDELSKSEE